MKEAQWKPYAVGNLTSDALLTGHGLLPSSGGLSILSRRPELGQDDP